MALKSEFTVDDVTFQFENSAGGKETISAGGEICSEKRSMFGCTHIFEYQGHDYLVKPKPGIMSVSFKVEKDGEKIIPITPEAQEKISPLILIACGWPFALVAFGGAIGGGLGGVAFAVNIGIYKSSLPGIAKPFLNILTGAAAIGLWYVIAKAIAG